MARRAATASRYSRTADRNGPAESSPFRSSVPRARMLGAEAMVAKRDAEIAMLEGLLRMTSAPAKQKVLTLRLLASIRNRNSWLDYLANGFQKETRAVITPPAKSKSKPTTH